MYYLHQLASLGDLQSSSCKLSHVSRAPILTGPTGPDKACSREIRMPFYLKYWACLLQVHLFVPTPHLVAFSVFLRRANLLLLQHLHPLVSSSSQLIVIQKPLFEVNTALFALQTSRGCRTHYIQTHIASGPETKVHVLRSVQTLAHMSDTGQALPEARVHLLHSLDPCKHGKH